MPNRFIYEDKSGVMLQVEYSADELISVRLLDADYRACGPELSFMLDRLFHVVEVTPRGEVTGEPYLNSVFKEIQSGRLLRAPPRK